MSDQGEVRTCFLTARLPRWAGVRHNVLGSNISGLPVPSPETFSTQRSVLGSTLLTMRNIATTRPVEEQLETLTDQLLQLTTALNAATERLTALETRCTNIERDLEPVLVHYNAIN